MSIKTSLTTGQHVAAAFLFPAALAFALVAPIALPSLGIPIPAAQLSVFIVAMLLSWVAQRVVPFREGWSGASTRERVTDASSLAAVMFVVDPLMKGGLIAGLSVLATTLAWTSSVGEVIAAWPYAVALAVTVLIAEFAPYWLHRFAHQPGWLWRFHSIHHSPGRIYWLNAFRSHPVNIVWYIGATFGVLVLLGFPEPLIQGYLAIGTVAGVFQHCNGRLHLGPLNWVFSTNEHHRWHHDLARAEKNCNFGSTLIVWDRVFGTFYNVSGSGPEQVGIVSPHWPAQTSYLTLLAAPFKSHLWEPSTARAPEAPGASKSK